MTVLDGIVQSLAEGGFCPVHINIYIYINTGLVMVWWMKGNWEVRNGERGAFYVSCFNGGDIWGLFFVVIVVWRNS